MRFRPWVCGLFLVGELLANPNPVVSLDSPPVPCHNPEQCFAEFLVELAQFTSGSSHAENAQQAYLQLVTAHSQTVWASRARLRYGHALRTMNPHQAIPFLQGALTDFPALDDYLHFWLFQAYVNADIWPEATKVAQEFIDGHHESLVRGEVLYEGGLIFSKFADCTMTRSLLSKALEIDPQHSKAANALFQIGKCVGQLGQQDELVKLSRELWWQFPMTPQSLQAEQWLAQEGGQPFVPSLGERYQRGMTFYNKGLLRKAVKEFQKVGNVFPSSPQFFQSQFMLAKAYVRLKQYDQAEKVLQVLVRSSSSRQNEAWVWLGRTYLRQSKGEALSNLVKALPVGQLTGDQQAQLYTFLGIWLDDHDRWPEAVEAYEKAGQVATTPSTKDEAWWKVGWIHYQREQFSDAIDIFQRIIQETTGQNAISSVYAVSQAWYWLARSEEHLGNMPLALQYFQEIIKAYPLTYYGQLAQARMGLTGGEAHSWTVLASDNSQRNGVPGRLQHNVHYQRLMALQAVELTHEARQELEQVYASLGTDTEMFPQIVNLAGTLGAYDIGIRLAIRHFGQTLRTGQLPSTSPAWSGAFPMGYQTIIQSVVPHHVDPFLVSGLIREESLYSAQVVSPVGAIGLMQLMPATAKNVAQQLHLSDLPYDYDRLYQPEYNIRVGTYYLGQLLNEFQGNIIYAVAAYNAGPRAVKRWIAKNGHRPTDEFVELIGYRETRGYVKRVVGSYRIYRTLFGQTCPPISLDRFC
ncbi:MAG: transglycosylase SLT domain-containing protein [Nitrospirales bacterium]